MNKKDIIIRLEESKDYFNTENMVRNAFWNVYRPGCLEHYVLHNMRECSDFVPELDFVMEKNAELIGQVAFANSVIETNGGFAVPVLTVGPVCIKPELQHMGYGKLLLDYALDRAAEYGYGAALLEGNYGFYSKCGFTYAFDYGIRYKGCDEDTRFFLCKELKKDYLKNASGSYAAPECYFVDEAQVEEFDKLFEPKEKLVLDSQIF